METSILHDAAALAAMTFPPAYNPAADLETLRRTITDQFEAGKLDTFVFSNALNAINRVALSLSAQIIEGPGRTIDA